MHMISAWCDSQRLVLGQRPSAGKGNGIKDIPELLELLQLKGAIVTIDAMGCQRAIAEKIRDRGGGLHACAEGEPGHPSRGRDGVVRGAGARKWRALPDG